MQRFKPAVLLMLVVIGLLAQFAVGWEGDSERKRIDATNAGELRAAVGQEVTVFGKIDSIGESSSGHQFLNFFGKQISVFCGRDDVANFKAGEPAELFGNKEVEVTGQISLFRNRPEIDSRHVDGLSTSLYSLFEIGVTSPTGLTQPLPGL